MKKIYLDNFDCREDVEREFEVKLDDECEILLAIYTYGDYDGDAMVIGRRGETLFMMEASHCSCYGLEGQWNEDETSLATLKYMLENGKIFHRFGVTQEVTNIIHRLGGE